MSSECITVIIKSSSFEGWILLSHLLTVQLLQVASFLFNLAIRHDFFLNFGLFFPDLLLFEIEEHCLELQRYVDLGEVSSLERPQRVWAPPRTQNPRGEQTVLLEDHFNVAHVPGVISNCDYRITMQSSFHLALFTLRKMAPSFSP
jgi:hypothetical protein